MDMDGTLTPPRGRMSHNIGQALLGLAYYADLGIVSGSNFEYVYEQTTEVLGSYSLTNRTTLMPCNGTQVYDHTNKGWVKRFSVSMREELGEEIYLKLVKEILECQAEIVVGLPEIPITGKFVNYREGTINWSLIGRDATQKQRDFFAEYPNNNILRKLFMDHLSIRVNSGNLDYALGGQTGIDIFPKGWDKTFALRHLEGRECWFIGDRCEPGQNDFHIWKELNKVGRSFKTSGPVETIEIIDSIAETLSHKKR
jgi:phosphomannomutase